MSLKLRVETELDERSATSAANKAQQEFEEAARNVSRAWRDNVDTGLRGVSGSFTRTAREASESFRTHVTTGVRDAVSSAAGEFGTLGRAAESAFGGMSTKAVLAAGGVAGIGIAAVAVGKQLYDLGAQFDDMADGITAKTGIMGDQLNTMMESVKNVGRNTAIPLQDIANISAGVAQSLHLSGTAADAMTQKIADLQQVTGQGLDIRGLGKAFRLFDVKDVQDQVNALNGLVDASQKTGKPLDELIGSLQNTGKTAKEFGFSLGETVGILSTFEDAGLSADSAANALSLGLKNIAKSGSTDVKQSLEDVVAQIKRLHDAGDEAGAINLANSTFGKSMKDVLPIIEDGTLDVKQMHDAINTLGANDTIEKQKQATADWNQQWVILGNTLRTDVQPAATLVFQGVNLQLQTSLDLLEKVGQKWSDLASLFRGPNPQLPANNGPFGVGPMGAPGSMLQPTPSGIGGAARDGSLLPGNSTGTWWGYQPPDTSKPPKGPRLPEAPSLPYDTTLPQGLGNLPQTSAIVSAENSYLDARHALAEKEARLNQLKQDSNATANDIQKAENDVINAKQAQQQTELRLADAAQNLYDQQNKQLNSYADQMGDIGAKLDKDLGVSKGLAGLAENLFKFLADLAFAPALGAMKGVQAGLGFPGDSAGSGLFSIAADLGVFGPDMVPTSPYANKSSASGSGPQAVLNPDGSVSMSTAPTSAPPTSTGGAPTGGYAGDTALLSNVPAGSYSEPGSGAWDLTKGLGDCSSAVEDLVNIMEGRPTAGRSMSTDNEAQWLTEHGFSPGLGGPGDFRVGFNSSHTQATLPGGTPFNWGSDEAAARGGVGGTGADDPAFTSHYYRRFGSGGPALTTTTGAGLPVPLPVTVVGGGGSGGGWGLSPPPGAGPSTQTGGAGGVPQGAAPGSGGGGGGGELTITGNPALGGPTFPGNTSPGLTPGTTGAPSAGTGPAAAPGLFSPGGALAALPTHGFGGTGMPFGLSPAPGIGGPGIGSALSAGIAGIGEGGIGGGAGATLIGGMAPPQGTGKGGIGMSGGVLGAAIGAGEGAANMFAPGAGAAIQIGVQEISRAIQFGSQVAGIAVSGLQETFGFGQNTPLAQSGWGNKLLGGIVGAGVMLPNVAGAGGQDKAKGLTADQMAQQKAGEKGGQQLTPEQLAEQQKKGVAGGQGTGPAPGPSHNNTFNINNGDRTEAGTGRDAAWYINQQQQQYAPAAMP
jgi:Phage-related minor tail protein